MPNASIITDGKKLMWDGVIYESQKEAEDVMQKYKSDGFEVEIIEVEKKHFIYTRRVVKEIVLEGKPQI